MGIFDGEEAGIIQHSNDKWQTAQIGLKKKKKKILSNQKKKKNLKTIFSKRRD